MGSARGSLQLLARRLSAERAARPVVLVWTKSDVAVATEMEKAVREAVFGPIPDAHEFLVSIAPRGDEASDKGQGLLELLEWVLGVRRGRVSLPPVRAASSDFLFIFGAS